ncbi:competence protein CoiA [Carnobacterium funditum]|uniref:competence protein CoiA n=1 Tax=Carnobacterium funditum TaxID=2752 RepID=UPI00055359CB|nr:competence protein CoiA family protein [Carnobacterium funditum]
MLIALNGKNQTIHANKVNEEIRGRNLYYCPDCKECVFLKKGVLKVAHFSHFNQTNCRLFSEGETKEHLQGKQILYDWFIKQGLRCELEAYLPNLNQRPDILVWVNQTRIIAIEFQCSSMPLKRMEKRTAGYKKNGYDVFWILGSQFKLTDKITAFQRLFIYSDNQLTSSLFFLDVSKKNIYLYSNIQQKNITQRIVYDSYLINLDYFKLSEVLMMIDKIKRNSKKTKYLYQPKDLIQSHLFLNQGRMYQTPEIVSFQKYIYQNGDSLISIPKEVYFKVPGQITIKTLPHFWKYILLKWLTANKINSVITLNELDNQIDEMIKNKSLVFHPMPLISLEVQKKPIYFYVQLLIESAILEKNKSNQWVLIKKPYCYKNEQEKLAAFQKDSL